MKQNPIETPIFTVEIKTNEVFFLKNGKSYGSALFHKIEDIQPTIDKWLSGKMGH